MMDVIFEHNLAAYLWIIFGPVLLIIGVFGNCLSLMVLIGPSFSKNSAAFGLSALAVVDTGVLVVSLLRQWIYYFTDGVDVRVLFFSFGCKFQAFLAYFLSQLSSWTVVLVTIERALSVLCPLTVRSRITRSRTILTWILLSFMIFFINAHFFWTIELFIDIQSDYNETSKQQNTSFYYDTTTELSATSFGYTHDSSQTPQNTDKYLCFFKLNYLGFSATVLPWLDFFLTVAIPFLLIAFFNILIAICVWRTVAVSSLYCHHPSVRQSFRESLSADEHAATNQDVKVKRSSDASDSGRQRRRSVSCVNLKLPGDQGGQESNRRDKRENKSKKSNEESSDHYSDAFYAGPRFSRDERIGEKSVDYKTFFNHDSAKQNVEPRVSNESDSLLKMKFGRLARDGHQKCTNSPASQDHPPCGQKLSFQSVALSTPPRKQFSVRKRDQILAPFTAMLVGLGVMFLLTNAPSGVYFILQESLFAKIADNDDYSQVGPLRLAYAIVNILYFVNHSANFLLYCLTGSKFRMALRKTLRCQKKTMTMTQIKLARKPIAPKTPNSRNRHVRADSEPRGYDDDSLRGYGSRHLKFATMNAF